MIPRLALTAWILVLALLMLGAYLRHTHAGSGCNDWPACYGRIGPGASTEAAVGLHTATIPEPQPGWATRAHRAVAGLIAVAVVALAALAVARRAERSTITLALLALANLVFLVALGLWAGGSRNPMVTVGNLMGGITLLGLLWWLQLLARPSSNASGTPSPLPASWIILGLVLIYGEITVGALGSASYSALACSAFPACNGAWWPMTSWEELLTLLQPLPVDHSGRVLNGAPQAAIQQLHRYGALAVLVWGVVTVLWRVTARSATRKWHVVVLAMIVLQVVLGIVLFYLPSSLTAALAHNAAASLLLVALLTVLHHRATERKPAPCRQP